MEHSNARIIRNKLGLLNLAQELNNVSRACKIMGLSRDTFYRYQAAVEQGGVEALVDKSRRKPNPKNRIDEVTEAAVVAFAVEFPAYGQVRASNELRKRGVFISQEGRGRRCGADRGAGRRAGAQGGGRPRLRRDRDRSPRLSRLAGHLLRRHV